MPAAVQRIQIKRLEISRNTRLLSVANQPIRNAPNADQKPIRTSGSSVLTWRSSFRASARCTSERNLGNVSTDTVKAMIPSQTKTLRQVGKGKRLCSLSQKNTPKPSMTNEAMRKILIFIGKAGPTGKVQKVFEEVSGLPRRQQEKIIEFVTAYVRQYQQSRQ
jgi:hypothetical protein